MRRYRRGIRDFTAILFFLNIIKKNLATAFDKNPQGLYFADVKAVSRYEPNVMNRYLAAIGAALYKPPLRRKVV